VTWNQSRSRSKSTTLLVAAVLPLGAPSCSWGRHPPSPNPFPFVVRTAAAESSHPLPVGRRRLPVLLRAAFFSSSSRPSRPPRPRPRAASRGRALPPPPWQPPPAPRARSGPSRAGSVPWGAGSRPWRPVAVRPTAPRPSPVACRPPLLTPPVCGGCSALRPPPVLQLAQEGGGCSVLLYHKYMLQSTSCLHRFVAAAIHMLLLSPFVLLLLSPLFRCYSVFEAHFQNFIP